MIDTKKADRRDLRFESLSDIRADMDRAVKAASSGRLRTTGNWSAGQIFQHVGKLMAMSFDGFPSKAPLALRLMGVALKPIVLKSNKPAPAGMRIPKDSIGSVLLPDDEISVEDGAAFLRAQLDRADRGERMQQRSPLFGKLSHSQWVKIHCGHAALHFSFLRTEPEA